MHALSDLRCPAYFCLAPITFAVNTAPRPQRLGNAPPPTPPPTLYSRRPAVSRPGNSAEVGASHHGDAADDAPRHIVPISLSAHLSSSRRAPLAHRGPVLRSAPEGTETFFRREAGRTMFLPALNGPGRSERASGRFSRRDRAYGARPTNLSRIPRQQNPGKPLIPLLDSECRSSLRRKWLLQDRKSRPETTPP